MPYPGAQPCNALSPTQVCARQCKRKLCQRQSKHLQELMMPLLSPWVAVNKLVLQRCSNLACCSACCFCCFCMEQLDRPRMGAPLCDAMFSHMVPIGPVHVAAAFCVACRQTHACMHAWLMQWGKRPRHNVASAGTATNSAQTPAGRERLYALCLMGAWPGAWRSVFS